MLPQSAKVTFKISIIGSKDGGRSGDRGDKDDRY